MRLAVGVLLGLLFAGHAATGLTSDALSTDELKKVLEMRGVDWKDEGLEDRAELESAVEATAGAQRVAEAGNSHPASKRMAGNRVLVQYCVG